MLDVHAPHKSDHTWTDFFIHIATIVIGLLIAIGLEQTVERIRQHQQVREARVMLRQEFEANRKNLAVNTTSIDAHLVRLWGDLAVVARARARKSLPGDQIVFIFPAESFQSVAWQTIHASNVSEHMDPHELADYGHLYQMQQAINDLLATANNQLQTSLSLLVASEDPRIDTIAQIQEIESHTDSAEGMATAIHLLNHDNHPERLTAAQLDSTEQGLFRGINEDRRLQRYLGALGRDYATFDKLHPAR
ncbi:MAG TPA: hypothetical protein VGF82_01895 [Terracidiphilus sp.]